MEFCRYTTQAWYRTKKIVSPFLWTIWWFVWWSNTNIFFYRKMSILKPFHQMWIIQIKQISDFHHYQDTLIQNLLFCIWHMWERVSHKLPLTHWGYSTLYLIPLGYTAGSVGLSDLEIRGHFYTYSWYLEVKFTECCLHMCLCA